MRKRHVAADTPAAHADELFRSRLEHQIDLRHPLARLIVDTTVQEKAIAHPTDSRLLEVARKKLVLLSRRTGMKLRQTYKREAPGLARQAGRHAHARQFKRMRRVLRRQRTLLGRVIRDIGRQLGTLEGGARAQMQVWLARAERIRRQRPKDSNKLYALHAPDVECIGKGKARKPYEFGVKVGIAVTARKGLVVGARSSRARRTTATRWTSNSNRSGL